MNNSVAVYTPKTKTYSKTNSLKSRVAIATCSQIMDHDKLWAGIFEIFGAQIDDDLKHYLQMRHRWIIKTPEYQKVKKLN